ncbi:MAG: rod shape-determining protein MreC [Candidatus Omnitrophica bacterium]|nr:rod shape-determining protein MreC [Candidatus Omnitrophota bacterium]
MLKGQKNFIRVIVILEAVLIVILAINGFKKTKENLALRLQLKSKEQETLLEKETLVKDLQQQLMAMQMARADLENEVKRLNETAKVLEGKLQGSKEATEILARQFGDQQKDIFERFNNITVENRKTFTSLLNKIEQLLHTKAILEKKLHALQKENNSEDTTLASSKNSEVDLGKISVTNRETTYPENILGYNYAGSILDVDNQYNFVIIDLGQESGVKPGSKFAVIRNKKKIGEIVLREVYKGMSLAESIIDKTPYRLRRGDKLLPIK